MTRADVFHEVGGFEEETFAVACNDVDLCLKIREKGYRVIYTPHALLYHHEAFSKTAKDLIPDSQCGDACFEAACAAAATVVAAALVALLVFALSPRSTTCSIPISSATSVPGSTASPSTAAISLRACTCTP